MKLNGQQFKQLRNALLAAFSLQEFDEMLLFQLDKDRPTLALGSSQAEIVLEVIKKANRQNWVLELLRAARESRPKDPELFLFTQRFELAVDVPQVVHDDDALQRIIRQGNRFLDVRPWRTKLATIEAQVCRIEVGPWPYGYGTGFLLGSDVVMTNYHVIEAVHKGQRTSSEVTLLFDYALLEDGKTQDPGTRYHLADPDWLIDCSEYSPLDKQADTGGVAQPPDRLDYALLRVAGSPGSEPVGGSNNPDPSAPPRRWIELPTGKHDFAPKSALFIMQHPDARALKLAIDMESIIELNGNGTRVRYRTNTEPGSSGSPCFDLTWNLIALHHAGDPNYNEFHKPEYNQGVPFTAILELLEQRGKKQELGR